MRSVGVRVHLPSKGRPAASVITLEGSWEAPVEVKRLELTSAKSDIATVLLDLAKGLRSHLSGIKPDRVVIRRADVAQQSSRTEGPKLRLLAEGALAAAAREELDDVLVLTGKDLSDRSPAQSKPALDKLGEELGQASHGDAAGAALAGLSI